MTAKKESRSLDTAASPAKSAVEELRALSKVFDVVVTNYADRIRREIGEMTAAVERLERTEEGSPRKNLRLSPGQLRDLRDMVMLLRNVEMRPEKGRRKDLKKIDTLVGDLRLLTEHWTRE